ncbi:alpha/beta hydrolase [Streptomyces aureoverticillatus]|uniref:alpha/beta hydrolase n=1 Tax=Streptomyces aureoverticillatus TaxID=66871 RepID=UPI0013DBFD08|nr:alpha/beta hydrolase [Streptomyces aureoverticillatus]QIB48354.1 alpha/beta hydrolase [Streptomyces aureoverticillatus]
MATFVLIHGGGDSGWAWHLLEAELRRRGHETVAPDLPSDQPSAGLGDYADAVVGAVGERRNLVVVGHSYGAFTAPLVADRLPVDVLVLLAGMIPAPGERPDDWWETTGCIQARDAAGLSAIEDPFESFYHDVPRKLAEESMRRERQESSRAGSEPWPLAAWPDTPTKFIVCKDDRFFPPEFFRGLTRARLGIVPDEIGGGHCVALSRPKELADLLEGYLQG